MTTWRRWGPCRVRRPRSVPQAPGRLGGRLATRGARQDRAGFRGSGAGARPDQRAGGVGTARRREGVPAVAPIHPGGSTHRDQRPGRSHSVPPCELTPIGSVGLDAQRIWGPGRHSPGHLATASRDLRSPTYPPPRTAMDELSEPGPRSPGDAGPHAMTSPRSHPGLRARSDARGPPRARSPWAACDSGTGRGVGRRGIAGVEVHVVRDIDVLPDPALVDERLPHQTAAQDLAGTGCALGVLRAW